MLALELKILILTLIYFAGWFIFEKVFSFIWEKFETPVPEKKKKNNVNMSLLATVTPLDQTARYINGLKSPDWRVRRISCIQLGEKRGSAVVKALIEALDDPREEVSIAAGEALAKIGDPSAIAHLSNHVKKLEKKIENSLEHHRAVKIS